MIRIRRAGLPAPYVSFLRGQRHLLFALHSRWRLRFTRPSGKPGYRRLFVGPLEIEWF